MVGGDGDSKHMGPGNSCKEGLQARKEDQCKLLTLACAHSSYVFSLEKLMCCMIISGERLYAPS